MQQRLKVDFLKHFKGFLLQSFSFCKKVVIIQIWISYFFVTKCLNRLFVLSIVTYSASNTITKSLQQSSLEVTSSNIYFIILEILLKWTTLCYNIMHDKCLTDWWQVSLIEMHARIKCAFHFVFVQRKKFGRLVNSSLLNKAFHTFLAHAPINLFS